MKKLLLLAPILTCVSFGRAQQVSTTSATKVNTLSMSETIQNLGEVRIAGRKPMFEQQADRMVINVQGSVIARASSALDILEHAPGVSVNRQNNVLSMQGKSGVTILINGKPSRLPIEAIIQQLSGMSGSNIARIELIASPPSQYDAEGNAGAINIILKKNLEEGLNGAVMLSGTTGLLNSAKGSLDLNWRQKQLNIYGSASGLYGVGLKSYLEHDRSFKVGNIFYASVNQQHIHHNPVRNASVQAGLDYQWRTNTKIGMIGNWGYTYWGMRSDSKTIGRAGDILTDSILSRLNTSTITRYAYVNANVVHQFNAKHQTSIDVDHARYLLSNHGRTQLEFIHSQLNPITHDVIAVTKDTPFRILAGKVDHVWSIARGEQVLFGFKTGKTIFDNKLEVKNKNSLGGEPGSGYSVTDKISEQTHAAYINLKLVPAKRLTVQAGVRYEYNNYTIKAAQNENDYQRKSGKWFPTLFATYELDSAQRLQFSYSRRVNRPSYAQLAAYYIFLDPYQIVTGNPTLQPAYAQSFNLGYSWRSVVLTLNYSEEKNAIFWRNMVDTEKRFQLNQQHNFDLYKLAAMSISLPIRPARWWDMQMSATLSYRTISDRVGREFSVHLRKVDLMGNFSQTFTLSQRTKLEMNGKFNTAFQDGEQARSARGALDIAVQYQVGRRGARLSLGLMDVFNSADLRDWDFQQEDHAVRTYGVVQFSHRHVKLTFSQSFGSAGIKNARQRSTASEEERNRAK